MFSFGDVSTTRDFSPGTVLGCFRAILADNSAFPPSLDFDKREALSRMLLIIFDRFELLIVFDALKAPRFLDLVENSSRFLASRFFRSNYLAAKLSASYETSSLNLCFTL